MGKGAVFDRGVLSAVVGLCRLGGLDSLALVAFYGDPVEIPETGQVTRSRGNSELALSPLFPREEGWGDTK